MISEVIRKEQARNNLTEEIDQNKIAEILLELMNFSTREKAFEHLQNYLKAFNPNITAQFEYLDHEWLSYTTVGRADLIYFESWVDEHHKRNLF